MGYLIDQQELSDRRYFSTATRSQLLRDGICPECIGGGCVHCDGEGHVGVCVECLDVVPESQIRHFCCAKCNEANEAEMAATANCDEVAS